MKINSEHKVSIKEVQHWILLYGLGVKNGQVIPYPSAEYIRNNLLTRKTNEPLHRTISQSFEQNPALKGDKTWELLAHWYIEGLPVEGYDASKPNPLEEASVKLKDLEYFLKKSHYITPAWLLKALDENEHSRNLDTNNTNTSKVLPPKALNSLYRMVLGMAIKKYDFDPESSRNKATGNKAGSISADLEKAGLPVTNDTIKRHLNTAFSTTPPER